MPSPAPVIASGPPANSDRRFYLKSPGRRLIFVSVCFLVVGVYCYRAARSYVASRDSEIVELRTLERATRLEPANAEYFDRLGRFLAFAKQDINAALRNYLRSVALNPYVADYWLDLARAYQFSGDTKSQEHAVSEAVRVDPRTPNVAWQAGNFYLLQGDTQKALQLFRVSVENDPYNADAALNLAWRATHDPVLILRDTVPPQPEAYFRFLRLLLGADQREAAGQVWQQLVGLGKPLDVSQALLYVDFCLSQRNVHGATEAWNALLELNPQLHAYRSPDERVVNGSFEEDILNGGFDWHYRPASKVKVSVDNSVVHGGLRSLAIEFSHSRADPDLWQLVAVEPETDYRFSAFIKAEQLDGANGPRFLLTDTNDNFPYVLTEDVLGSTAWRELKGTFKTRNETHLLAIHVVRSPQETLLDGKVWIDDVSIRRK